MEYISEIYPIEDPTSNEVIQSFDECFTNWIGKSQWDKIIEKINSRINQNNNRLSKMEKEFYLNFMEWIEKELEWADIIVVEGNL